jgi:5-methylcytosine-specific restriction protein A
MSQHIRIGNVYHHTEYDAVVVTNHDHDNEVSFRVVKSRDNGGVTSVEHRERSQSYDQFLGAVRMRDYPDDENWQRLRKYVYHRDGGVCQGCGTSVDRSAPVHHICPLGAGGTNKPSNLLLLCGSCHGAVHRGPL